MASNQNEIDKEFTAPQLAEIDTALDKLEQLTADLPVLSAAEKAGLVKPPDGAGGWMQGMALRAQQNLGKLSREYDPARVRKDLDLDAAIEPRELRLARLLDRFGGGRFLARSDAFAALLGARRQLREAGVSGVDDDLSDGLRRFFSRSSPDKPAAPGGTAVK